MLSMDAGFFGPRSVSWRVHGELTVLFAGARALPMQSAHPLGLAALEPARPAIPRRYQRLMMAGSARLRVAG